MLIYYVLLFTSALLFAGQFLLTKLFQKYNGQGLQSTLKLTIFAYLTIAIFFFVKAQIGAQSIKFGFSIFTLLMTLGISVISISCVYLSIKVLSFANMSVYSMFMMIGSIIMPSLVGLIFYKETLTWLKAICIILVLVAVVLTIKVDKQGSSLKALICYVGVFFLNGMIGVLFTIHQNQPNLSAYSEYVDGILVSNSDVFMSWYGISTVIVSLVAFIILKISNAKKKQEISQTQNKCSLLKVLIVSLIVAVSYGLTNGFGNYFISISTTPNALGSSITFPIVDGGTIVFSTLLGVLIYKEKLSFKTIVSCVLIVISTILFMFV